MKLNFPSKFGKAIGDSENQQPIRLEDTLSEWVLNTFRKYNKTGKLKGVAAKKEG